MTLETAIPTNSIPGDQFLHQLLNLGELMLSNGAEVNRVEDTLTRMGMAYGAAHMNVFVITSSIVITIIYPDNNTVTETRRINSPGGTDFKKVERCNSLSRECCSNPLPLDVLAQRIWVIGNNSISSTRLYVGSVLAALGFALFFGGTWIDAITAAVFGAFIALLQLKAESYCANKTIFNLLSSFVIGSCICLLSKLIPVLQPDKVMIGDIMLLIPGIALTNSVRDIVVGDTISGIMRLIESLLWAFALACGFMIAILLIL